MTNHHYNNGRNAEYRAKKRLEEDGWTVFRTAGSKTPCDLVAIRPGDLVFVQVKNGQRAMPRVEKASFREFAVAHRARPLLISRGNVWEWLEADAA